MPQVDFCFGLLRRREVILPSFRGWLFLLVVFFGLGFAIIRGLHPFLAPKNLVHGEALVVEGWIPEYSQREALALFRSGGYKFLIATGGPLPPGRVYSKAGTYAKLTSLTLMEMGLGADSILVVPSKYGARDRTYLEGVALANWIKAEDTNIHSLDLFTFSAHGRRSLLLFRKALGKQIRMGIYSARDYGYDPDAWWKYSDGVRRMIDETIAYFYAVFLFHPEHVSS